MKGDQIPPPALGTVYHVYAPPTPNEPTITPNPPFPSGVLDLSDIPVAPGVLYAVPHPAAFYEMFPETVNFHHSMSGFPDFPGCSMNYFAN